MTVDWQAARLPKQAIPVTERLPTPQDHEVIAWVSDASVAIHYFPVVAWLAYSGHWWAGVPGSYIDLAAKRWEVTHWLPLSGLDGDWR